MKDQSYWPFSVQTQATVERLQMGIGTIADQQLAASAMLAARHFDLSLLNFLAARQLGESGDTDWPQVANAMESLDEIFGRGDSEPYAQPQ